MTETDLSPARRRLAAAIEALRAAQADHQSILTPAQRLGELIREADVARREVELMRDEDDAALAAWLVAGSDATRPDPAPALVAAEQQAARAERDARAARAAMGAYEAKARVAAERVSQAAIQRDQAAIMVAIEIAGAISADYSRAAAAAVEIEAKMHALHVALDDFDKAAPGSTSARSAATKVDEMRVAVRQSAAAKSDLGAARHFLDQLRADAGAQFGQQGDAP